MSFMVISHQKIVTIFMVKLLGLSFATHKQESLADRTSSCSPLHTISTQLTFDAITYKILKTLHLNLP